MSKGVEQLASIIRPVSLQVAAASVETDGGIVLVIHNPGALAIEALKNLGFEPPVGRTTVYGIRREDALPFGTDPITLRWITAAPVDGEISVYLASGDGTALLTLCFHESGKVVVKKESDMHLV